MACDKDVEVWAWLEQKKQDKRVGSINREEISVILSLLYVNFVIISNGNCKKKIS